MITEGSNWFTAAQLAALGLPGLPRDKRKINERAGKETWALRRTPDGTPLARPRQGRGGGLEYHVEVIPAASRAELVKRGLIAANDVVSAPIATPSGGWDWFERQPESVKTEARRRASIVECVERHESVGGLSRTAAVASASAAHGASNSTIWGWLRLAADGARADRLVLLAPRRGGGGAEADIDDEAWTFLKSDYLRPERPTFSSCYWRLKRDYAEPRGLTVPCERTLRRKLDREVDGRLVIAKRHGAEAVRRTLPPQQRSVAQLSALELVNIDGHKFDVFVKFADGRVGRPIMVATQDIYSRKFLSWRIGETESAVMTRLAFADLFEKFGIPAGCVLDNGRAFASKWITGGAKSRYRFKIRAEEPTGVLTALGIAIHWALPYRGQSKPIERGFRDLCDTISRHPALAGAYTGNTIDAKPENYGERAVPIAEFEAIVARGIAAHNAKPGRRTEAAAGRSFDTAFAESYARSAIGRATPEQLRLALLTADELSTDRQSGHITLYGNRYWAEQLVAIAGTRVTARFDPDDLTKPLHVYDRAGRFIVSAELIEATGFLDANAAKKRAKLEADYRKQVRRMGEFEQLLDATDLAAMLPAYADEAAPELSIPGPSVIRPVRHRGNTALALKPLSEVAEAPATVSFIDKFTSAVPTALRLVD